MSKRELRAELRAATEAYTNALDFWHSVGSAVEWADVLTARAALDALHEEAARDAERLDWIESDGRTVRVESDGACAFDVGANGTWFFSGKTARAAIDAARSPSIPRRPPMANRESNSRARVGPRKINS